MDDRKLYCDTFSQVRSARGPIRLEDIKMRKNHTILRKILVLAAVLALFTALAATAYAVDLFGLRSLLLPPSTPSQRTGWPQVSDPEIGEDPYLVQGNDAISLQGFVGTPEAMATAEWRAFNNRYDPDGAILAEIGNDPTGFEGEYDHYLVYTQEMADELERILAKYHLKKHTDMRILDSYHELCQELAGDDMAQGFLMGMHEPYTPYIYEDGTFHYDGDVNLPEANGRDDYYSEVTCMYQCTRCVKGTFTDIGLTIGDIDDFKQWTYRPRGVIQEDGTYPEGPEVILALGPKVSLVIADLGDSFVTFNILAGTDFYNLSDCVIGENALEIFADSIDWTVIARIP